MEPEVKTTSDIIPSNEKPLIRHGPPIKKYDPEDELCRYCGPQTDDEKRLFSEAKENLCKILHHESVGNNKEHAEELKKFRTRLMDSNSSRLVVKLCDSTETGGYDTLLHT